MQNTGAKSNDAMCAILNITILGKQQLHANLSQKLSAVLEVDASLADRLLITPLVRQYHLAKCAYEFKLPTLATYELPPGSFPETWYQVVVPGILAWFSVFFNLSLIMVTAKHVKEHKVCNWLLAFDALCQLFVMSVFLANFFAALFGANSVDFRVCMTTLVFSVMGMHSSLLTIFIISLERMLLTLAPMAMSQLETPSKVRKVSLIAACVGTFYGLYMSCTLLLYVNELIMFNTTYDNTLYCSMGVYLSNINTSVNYVILLLCQMNYAVIFALLIWRYHSGATNGDSIRRVFRAVFILSLVVLFGWLLSVSTPRISAFLNSPFGLPWLFRLFGTEPNSVPGLYNSILAAVLSSLGWLSVVASAGGAPILFFTSTEYGSAYKKMFSRTSAASSVGPLFINQRHPETGMNKTQAEK